MKKSLIAAAALCAVAGTAQASSVTLYGLLDQGLNFQNNAGGNGSLLKSNSGGRQGSRWGLRGAEDLGGGLKAIFVLENGFDLGNGRTLRDGQLFGRQAFVGLSGSQFGAITLGRQTDSVVDFVSPLSADAQFLGGLGGHIMDLDNFDLSFRANNSIKFTSLNYSGLTIGGSITPGGVAGKLSRGLVWSVGAGYNAGPLVAGIGYIDSRSADASPYRQLANAHFATRSPQDQTAAKLLESMGLENQQTRYKSGSAGISYTFGPSKLSATYSRSEFKGEAAALAQSLNIKSHIGEVAYSHQLSPALLAGIAYTYTRGTFNGDKKQFHQVSVGTDYALSKRTSVYATVAGQMAKGDGENRAMINGLTPSSSDRQIAARLGIRHRF